MAGEIELKIDTLTEELDSVPFSIGSSIEASPNYDFPKKTAIDELHVIGDALSPDEVRFLFENNRLK